MNEIRCEWNCITGGLTWWMFHFNEQLRIYDIKFYRSERDKLFLKLENILFHLKNCVYLHIFIYETGYEISGGEGRFFCEIVLIFSQDVTI